MRRTAYDVWRTVVDAWYTRAMRIAPLVPSKKNMIVDKCGGPEHLDRCVSAWNDLFRTYVKYHFSTDFLQVAGFILSVGV